MSTPAQPNYACSFCGKQQSQVRRLIAGPSSSARGIYICDECVRLCAEILDEEEGKGPAEWKQEPPKPSSSPARP